ncbi:MAG: hypothetical protein PHI97_34575 [Desulfobulbus sp.]|nr:hypothetical protein [Desulfobulbus sp.]
MELSEILNYYSRRWAIECFFRDCKQLLELGKGQIIGPLFKELADEHLLLAVMRSLWDRFRQILMLSSQLFSSSQDPEELFHFLDVLENSFTLHTMVGCAKL